MSRAHALALLLAACAGALPVAAAACGSIPIVSNGTGPVYAGTWLEIGNNVVVNNGSATLVTEAKTLTHSVVPAAGGNASSVPTALPPLSPAAFPATSGSVSVARNGSATLNAPPYLLNTLTVGDGATLTLTPGDYSIGNVTLGKNVNLRVAPDGLVRLFTNADMKVGDGASMNASPATGNAGQLIVFVYGARKVVIGKNVAFTGVLYAPAAGAEIEIDNNANIVGGLVTGGTVKVDKNVAFVYTPAVQAQIASATTCPPALATLNHLRIEHASGTGLTCTPSTLTLRACQDAGCATPFTGGVAGTMAAAGGGVVWPGGSAFSIAAGASTTTVSVQVTTAGPSVLAASAGAPAATAATQCNFGAPACSFVAADAGLLFDVPNHVAEQTQTVEVSAVKKADGSLACVPAFAGVTRPVALRCSYADPATGTLPVRVNGNALNAGNSAGAACDGVGQTLPLAFNASGVAGTTLAYADVGRVTLTATYTGSAGSGDAGLVMSGSDGFIAAPASFGFSAIGAAPLRAGIAFAATVTARNGAGTATPNFGRETAPEGATIGFVRRFPTGAGASDGAFSGSLGGFSAGSASAANLVWTEVGRGDLTAALASGSYLGSGLGASGSTGVLGAVGPFIPHHFDVAATPACGAAFSYAGQPFAVTVTARNGLALAGTTVNYDGSAATSPSHAKAVTLSEAVALGLGSLTGAAIAASAFTAGQASASPSYAFAAKMTAPQTLVLRATDTDAVSSSGHAEGWTPLRSGRLRLANAFGAATQPLQLPVLAEYWSGNAWLLNSADHCTAVPASAVAISNPRNHQGGASAATTSASAISIAGGNGVLSLAAPSPAASVGFDIAINLGSSAADQSCLASHPATVGAARAWLRSFHGSCAASADRDPAARASFGIYSPETRKTVHVRELY